MQPIESEQTSGTKQLASGSTTTPAATVQQIIETQHTLQQANLLAVHFTTGQPVTRTQIQNIAYVTTGQPVMSTQIQNIMPCMHHKQGGHEQKSEGWYHQE
jgi:hypothetical protein